MAVGMEYVKDGTWAGGDGVENSARVAGIRRAASVHREMASRAGKARLSE
jgi:hypothetical protein